MAIALTALAVAVGQSFTSVPMLFAEPRYFAQLSDTGGLRKGSPVRIAGLDVGKVEQIAIDGDHIRATFVIGRNLVGTESRFAVRTDTILGKKLLELEPRGATKLRPGATLPVSQSSTPYQIYEAISDLTKSASGWDIDTVKRSLHVLAQTVDQTYPHLSAALDGVAKFSDTIGNRDGEVQHLLTQAHQVADILGDRGEQVDKLLVNTNTLLAAVNERGRAISMLLRRISDFSTQVQGLINDNPNLNRVLEQLRTISAILAKHKNDLAATLTTIGKFAPALSEVNASGPFLNGMIVNILPYWMLQPWVDAAFKKRGISPEEFWRGAGLPAFRFPDPNGTRFPNGAPPPAPRVLEGTPDHPGPAVAPGSPCSYTPPPQLLPRPANPLPCADVDPSGGPFGPAPGGFPAIDVQASPPNPAGLPPTPGVPIAGRPGQPPPNSVGTPVPLPPGPPGARTEPLPSPTPSVASRAQPQSAVPGAQTPPSSHPTSGTGDRP